MTTEKNDALNELKGKLLDDFFKWFDEETNVPGTQEMVEEVFEMQQKIKEFTEDEIKRPQLKIWVFETSEYQYGSGGCVIIAETIEKAQIIMNRKDRDFFLLQKEFKTKEEAHEADCKNQVIFFVLVESFSTTETEERIVMSAFHDG